MEYAIVDLQGFKDNSNNFIIKEFSFATKNIKFSDIIQSTCAFDELSIPKQKSANWLTDNFHGITWYDGDIDVNELRDTIKPILSTKIVFVKGEEKIIWLKNLLRDSLQNVVNIETLGCNLNLHKNSEMFGMMCSKHKRMSHNLHCALNNVSQIFNWYLAYRRINKHQQ